MNDIEKLLKELKEHDSEYYGVELSNPQIQICIEALEEKLNGGWIPVSERLPEEYGCYLVAWRPLNLTAEIY